MDGKLVVIELKRDDTGSDAHWQAIKYASYFQRATPDDVVEMAADYWNEPQEDAITRLLQHLGADDLNALNNDQRIILASHRFAPEVTSAALWLNKQGQGENMVTCVKLTPHQDLQAGALYVQASTIIPVPGIDDYLVGIGRGTQRDLRESHSTLGAKLTETFARNRNDEVTPFLRKVGQLAVQGLPDEIRPDKTGRWAGQSRASRYYNLWYSRPPWGNWRVNYSAVLIPTQEDGTWDAEIWLRNRSKLTSPALDSIRVHDMQEVGPDGIFVRTGPETLSDGFADGIAAILRTFIEEITPIVDDMENESSEEDKV